MAFREYHHIDASVYLRAIEDEAKGDYRLQQEYISKLGRTFPCGISVIIVGEIVKKISDIESSATRTYLINSFVSFLKKQNIRVYSVHNEDIELFQELKGIETRAHEPEILALATAIREKAKVFVTYDKDLLHSAPYFKSEYGINVRKPT